MALKMFAASLFVCAIVSVPALGQEVPAGGIGQLCKAELAAVCAPSADGKDGKMGGIRCLFEKEAALGPECAAAVKVAEGAPRQAACSLQRGRRQALPGRRCQSRSNRAMSPREAGRAVEGVRGHDRVIAGTAG